MYKLSLLTVLGTIGLSVLGHAPVNAIDDHSGWGPGTPSPARAKKKMPDSRSMPQAAASQEPFSPVSSLQPQNGSWSSLTSSRNVESGAIASSVQTSLVHLLEENEELRRQLAQHAGTRAALEAFDPRVDPVFSIRWLNLFVGYPDPTSTNYTALRRQYYDASTGVFPAKQPPVNALKNQLGSEVTAWETRVNTAREAYKAAYLDREKKQKRLARKAAEDLTQTIDSLSDSIVQNAGAEEKKDDGKVNKKEGILKRATADAQNADLTFKKMQNSFLHEHPAGIQDVDGERMIAFLTPDELDRRFTWGHIQKLLATPYRTFPGQRNDPNNIKGLLLTDPIDIRIGINMLTWMIPHLERELAIFRDIRTRYKKDFVPKVTGGYFSPAIWSDWYNGSSAKTLMDELKQNYPSPTIAHFPQPRTDQEETLRLLRRDQLGLKLRAKFLNSVKRYQEIEVSALAHDFVSKYHGFDVNIETTAQTTHTTNKAGEHRKFPKPLSTLFLTVQTRLQLPPQQEQAEGDAHPPSAPVSFVPPKKVQMVTEYVSPKAMGFHRGLWPNVMHELLETKGRALQSSFGEGGSKAYRQLYNRYEGILRELTTYLKPFQVSDAMTLPAPLAFFFVTPEQPRPITPEAALDLNKEGITDQNLGTLRLLSGGKSEPVLHRYSSLILSGNTLQNPPPEAFSTSLTSLNASKNQIRNLQFVVPLTALKELDVSRQLLNDLSPFGNDGVAPLPNLQKLNLNHTGLSQISPLAGFSSLKVLHLSQNSIVTVAPLGGLRALEELYLSENQITTLVDLESLYNLRVLDVSRNPIKMLTTLVRLEALQVLSANGCGFTGSWSTILPLAKKLEDPRLKSLFVLQLKDNEKLDWTPYTKKSAHSSGDVGSNNLDFNLSFPALKALEVGMNTKLEATDGKAITLSALDHRKY